MSEADGFTINKLAVKNPNASDEDIAGFSKVAEAPGEFSFKSGDNAGEKIITYTREYQGEGLKSQFAHLIPGLTVIRRTIHASGSYILHLCNIKMKVEKKYKYIP
ncbi:hypothetical protein C5167_000176 [Papaver somniferum]|uniref:Uncharacterized protein n=1 Tax=Papaver somniferum TaxID=3469 RepID=A0A4Y7KVM1_PAPSO|nr:hypothetical protein C5167_000176 [Papaver somniferum]